MPTSERSTKRKGKCEREIFEKTKIKKKQKNKTKRNENKQTQKEEEEEKKKPSTTSEAKEWLNSSPVHVFTDSFV